ncbi:MAG: type I-U CRISPR-associated protein Cas8c [Thermoguttaceae bacterium]|nr:type I-U CRISPR-associated protein Cas8c [Thermoguttaceae bacterium]MDW8037571.1 type I-U CRISPR-associated protein Cas8c [Thermoguttaceae bacterium]
MNTLKPSFSVQVDVTNPGQFFACCGLLELASRLWPGCEGWFDSQNPYFHVWSEDSSATLERIIHFLSTCEISGLTEEQRKEREALEAEKRRLKKEGYELPDAQEARRKMLGEMAREGSLFIGTPFHLRLDWWQGKDEDPNTPKTWAGRQELHKVARSAQDAISHIPDLCQLFDYCCVLYLPQEYRKRKSDQSKSVEPFYFDARRFAHALDVGFSLDVQEFDTLAYPAVELLCLIGLQRFRPAPPKMQWQFAYSVWFSPVSAPIAAAIVSGAVPVYPVDRYCFSLVFRDDQRRYKAFDFATLLGG